MENILFIQRYCVSHCCFTLQEDSEFFSSMPWLVYNQGVFQDKTAGQQPVNKSKVLGGHHLRKLFALCRCLSVTNCKGFATKCET